MPLKVLYVANRIDPRDPDDGSGADHQFYTALRSQGVDVDLLGPFHFRDSLGAKAIKRVSRLIDRRPPKYYPDVVRKIGAAVRTRVEMTRPDLVFSLFFPTLIHVPIATPTAVRCDTTFLAWQRDGLAGFSWPALRMGVKQETKAFRKCRRIITHSQWCADSFHNDYGIARDRIACFPNPAALPLELVGASHGPREVRPPGSTLQLLLVGRSFHRKGMDIAIDVVRRLNARGTQSVLRICGIEGADEKYVKYLGLFKKKSERELKSYIALYREADLLLHPARFDPSPIVTSEAAAFGLPVITRDVGGIATSVEDGVSGIVLPAQSTAERFTQEIINLMSDRSRYLALRRSSRARFEQELNWAVAGNRLVDTLMEAVRERSGSFSTGSLLC